MSTPSESPSEKPGPNEPAEHPPQTEISGVVLAPAPREATLPEIHYEHFPRTSFSPTQLSERRKRMRPVVTWVLGIALVLIAAAGIRSAFTSHETKAPAASVEETPAHAAAPATETETPPPADEANTATAGSDGKLTGAQAAQHHKTSQSHRPTKKPAAH